MDRYAHRKAERHIVVLKDGQPLSDAAVSVNLVNHKFLFGAGAFDFLSLVSGGTRNAFKRDLGDGASFLTDTPEEAEAKFAPRVEKWLNLLNYGTVPFYFDAYEPREGFTEYTSRKLAVDLMRANNKAVKGHNLVWHTCCPRWLMNYDNKTILDKLIKRIDREVGGFKDSIGYWDVINEPVIMPVYDKYDNALTRVCNEIGQVQLIKEVFTAAHAANPNAELLINDFNLSDKYADLIDKALEAGAPITTIGLQTHQHQGYMGVERLHEILKRFEKFGLPMHFTEISILSGKIVPPEINDLNDVNFPEWPSTQEGEERQVAQLQEFYDVLFDHPLVEAATNWDFADASWINAPTGYIHEDGTEKLSYKWLYNKINNEWTTKEDAKLDTNGGFVLNGFKGEYEITCGGVKKNFSLDCGEGDIIIEL